MHPNFANLPGSDTENETTICLSLHLTPSCECEVSVPITMDADHWRIKKVLTKSDVDGSSRLLIGRNQVRAHIAPFFTNYPSEFCQNNEERVAVFDVNTRTGHKLTLKKWRPSSFVLLSNWKRDFVDRRKLEENDEVGLTWDVNASRLEFAVLRKHQN